MQEACSMLLHRWEHSRRPCEDSPSRSGPIIRIPPLGRRRGTIQKNGQHDHSQLQQHLVEEMREDLRAGFNRVVEVYQDPLEQIASEMVGDTPRLAHQVEDIVQDGLLTAFARLKAHPEILTHHLKLQAWLSGLIAQQACAYQEREEQQLTVTAGL